MQDHLGEVFEGMISGVTEWGLYVELNENLCEGLIPMRDLADDYYDFDEKNHCLIGRRNNTRYRLGDKVKVKVARADLEKKQLDFVLDGVKSSKDEDDMGYTRPEPRKKHSSKNKAKTRSHRR